MEDYDTAADHPVIEDHEPMSLFHQGPCNTLCYFKCMNSPQQIEQEAQWGQQVKEKLVSLYCPLGPACIKGKKGSTWRSDDCLNHDQATSLVAMQVWFAHRIKEEDTADRVAETPPTTSTVGTPRTQHRQPKLLPHKSRTPRRNLKPKKQQISSSNLRTKNHNSGDNHNQT